MSGGWGVGGFSKKDPNSHLQILAREVRCWSCAKHHFNLRSNHNMGLSEEWGRS